MWPSTGLWHSGRIFSVQSCNLSCHHDHLVISCQYHCTFKFKAKSVCWAEYRQLLPCAHPAIMDTLIIRTAAKSQAKINIIIDVWVKYHKILQISPGDYIFQRPFLRGLFLEGLIFGGAYIQRGLSTEGNLRLKINWASLIVGSKFTVFALFYFVFEGNFPVTSPGGLIFGGVI